MVDQPTETHPPTAPAVPTPPVGDPPALTDAGDPQPKDEQLGEAGLKALQAEREARKALEEELKGLAPLKQLADAIRGGQHVPEDEKTQVEKLSEQIQQLQQQNEQERLGRLRLEVATAAGLTPEQAARLQGSSREELAADAAALLQLFPAVEQQGPRRPAPDPSQGGRGAPPDLQSQIAAAEAKGDWRTAMALKSQMLTN
jgi:hypothetical protein